MLDEIAERVRRVNDGTTQVRRDNALGSSRVYASSLAPMLDVEVPTTTATRSAP